MFEYFYIGNRVCYQSGPLSWALGLKGEVVGIRKRGERIAVRFDAQPNTITECFPDSLAKMDRRIYRDEPRKGAMSQ